MIVIAHDESIDIDKVPDDMCIDYEPDMFFKARIFIAKYGYAVAKDADHRVMLICGFLINMIVYSFTDVMSFQLSYVSQH